MPCTTYTPEEENKQLARREARSSRLLCEAYRILNDHGLMEHASADGQAWKAAHDESDRQRMEHDAAARRHRVDTAVRVVQELDIDEQARVMTRLQTRL